MKGKHTQGEWKAKYNGTYWEVRGADLLKPNIMVMDFNPPNADNNETCFGEETRATAKLIESTPKLLEVCIHALEMCNDKVMPTENDLTIMSGRLNQAIKQATS